MVFECLQDHRILMNLSKCKLGIPQLQFLGYQIGSQGIRPLPDKVLEVKESPQPTTTCKLREFLELVNFIHCFLLNAVCILRPLRKLLSATKRGSVKLQWSSEATSAFIAAKEALASATLPAYPKPNAPTSIMCDASDTAVGAVLQQYIGFQWSPIVYFVKQLQPAQTQYSTFNRELLAIYLSITHF